MPASLRAHVSRATSSRPYDRRSPTASPAQAENPLVHPHLSLSRNVPTASPIQVPDPDTPPDHPGLPTYADYKRIEAGYLHSLSPRKRDKALITQAMFDKIWDVLHQPDACTIETPQFRFWVRKMFTLSRPMGVDGGDGGWNEEHVGGTGTGMGTYPNSDSDVEAQGLELERAMEIRSGIGRGAGADADVDASTAYLFSAVVLHENRPVAIMEQLYELFCYCHVRAGHGGRDKTCAVIRGHYSWVPKELTAQFVKACPTCALKRSGHGGVGVGVDMGVLVQRRVIGQREKRVRGTPSGAKETPAPVVPSSLGSVGWPTTGGPLDPANPELCGVREREREWLRAREDARTIGLSSPVSPARVSVDTSGYKTRSVPREAALENCLPGVQWASTVDASPFHMCDTTTHSLATITGFPQPFTVENSRARRDREEKRSPTRTGLPSLASALSNESLDENVNLTGRVADECLLPPALRPLRLLGPCIPTDLDSSDPASSHLLQIDPVLLSFNYPMLLPSTAADSDISKAQLEGSHRLGARGIHTRLRAPDVDVESNGNISMPALTKTSDGDPSATSESDVSSLNLERAGAASYATGGAAALSTEQLARSIAGTSRCGLSRPYYGCYRDGPLAMLYQCSADEVGQELDGTLSFSIMTDA